LQDGCWGLNIDFKTRAREDNHPIIVIAGEDIANILLRAGISAPNEVQAWLERNFGNT